jgi:hypothetical protein
MDGFPRTKIGELDVSRMVIGTNWFLGWSHQSAAKDRFIKETQGRAEIAAVLEVFAREGVDITLGVRPDAPHFNDAMKDAEQRTGVRIVRIGTPILAIGDKPPELDKTQRILDEFVTLGCDILMPHQATTDALTDRRLRTIHRMKQYCALIRERGMIPGLSTHMPEVPIYADENELDVETYIQIYNAAGFLMQIEIDWVQRMIWQRKKPVLTIKPLAAGRLPPLVGLAFSWATLREQDLVCVGCYRPDEARECIEISRSVLERRAPRVDLQTTRSKASVMENKRTEAAE